MPSLCILGRPYIWGGVEHWGERYFLSLSDMCPPFSSVFSALLIFVSTLDVGSFFSLAYVLSSSIRLIFDTYSVRSITTVALLLSAGRMTMSVSSRRVLIALYIPLSRLLLGGRALLRASLTPILIPPPPPPPPRSDSATRQSLEKSPEEPASLCSARWSARYERRKRDWRGKSTPTPHSYRSYFTLLYSRLLYHGSCSLYFILHYSTMALLHSTLLYITLPWLYSTLHYSTLLYHGCTSFKVILDYSTMALVQSTLFEITQPWLYFTLLDSTLYYNGSTSLYFILY